MQNLQQGATSSIILNNKNEILLVERSLKDDFLPGYWELPGGGMDYGETPQESLLREIQEECGIEIEIVKPIAANTYFINELQRIEICFLSKIKTNQHVKLSYEHSNYRWVTLDDVLNLKISEYILNILQTYKTSLTL